MEKRVHGIIPWLIFIYVLLIFVTPQTTQAAYIQFTNGNCDVVIDPTDSSLAGLSQGQASCSFAFDVDAATDFFDGMSAISCATDSGSTNFSLTGVTLTTSGSSPTGTTFVQTSTATLDFTWDNTSTTVGYIRCRPTPTFVVHGYTLSGQFLSPLKTVTLPSLPYHRRFGEIGFNPFFITAIGTPMANNEQSTEVTIYADFNDPQIQWSFFAAENTATITASGGITDGFTGTLIYNTGNNNLVTVQGVQPTNDSSRDWSRVKFLRIRFTTSTELTAISITAQNFMSSSYGNAFTDYFQKVLVSLPNNHNPSGGSYRQGYAEVIPYDRSIGPALITKNPSVVSNLYSVRFRFPTIFSDLTSGLRFPTSYPKQLFPNGIVFTLAPLQTLSRSISTFPSLPLKNLSTSLGRHIAIRTGNTEYVTLLLVSGLSPLRSETKEWLSEAIIDTNYQFYFSASRSDNLIISETAKASFRPNTFKFYNLHWYVNSPSPSQVYFFEYKSYGFAHLQQRLGFTLSMPTPAVSVSSYSKQISLCVATSNSWDGGFVLSTETSACPKIITASILCDETTYSCGFVDFETQLPFQQNLIIVQDFSFMLSLSLTPALTSPSLIVASKVIDVSPYRNSQSYLNFDSFRPRQFRNDITTFPIFTGPVNFAWLSGAARLSFDISSIVDPLRDPTDPKVIICYMPSSLSIQDVNDSYYYNVVYSDGSSTKLTNNMIVDSDFRCIELPSYPDATVWFVIEHVNIGAIIAAAATTSSIDIQIGLRGFSKFPIDIPVNSAIFNLQITNPFSDVLGLLPISTTNLPYTRPSPQLYIGSILDKYFTLHFGVMNNDFTTAFGAHRVDIQLYEGDTFLWGDKAFLQLNSLYHRSDMQFSNFVTTYINTGYVLQIPSNTLTKPRYESLNVRIFLYDPNTSALSLTIFGHYFATESVPCTLPCRNGGSCNDSEAVCYCLHGWKGPDCSQKFNPFQTIVIDGPSRDGDDWVQNGLANQITSSYEVGPIFEAVEKTTIYVESSIDDQPFVLEGTQVFTFPRGVLFQFVTSSFILNTFSNNFSPILTLRLRSHHGDTIQTSFNFVTYKWIPDTSCTVLTTTGSTCGQGVYTMRCFRVHGTRAATLATNDKIHHCGLKPVEAPCSMVSSCAIISDTDGSNCNENNAFGSECDYEPVTITGGNPSQTTPSPAPPITVPPTQNITLPKTVLPLNEVCNIIIDIASKDEIEFDSTKHNEMCSVPTSGSLLVKTRKREIESGVYETDYICNCLCKGYWVDNPLTTDFKKCSKCSLSCPSNMTPNEECTACECVSSKCLSSLKLALPSSSSSSSSSIDTITTTPVPSYTPIQFFSAIYFDLAVLDIIQKPYQHDILTSTSLKQFITTQLQQPGVSLEDTPINQMNYAQQYYLQGSSTKVRNLYNTVMRDVANQIRKKMREDVILDNDENILDDSSFIFDVVIMPLVQSSYLVWKVVYFTTFDKRDYFMKPLDSTIISSMLLNAIKIANPPESQLPTPLPSDTIPTSDVTHLAKLITIPLTFAYYDHIITRCATSSSIASQSPTHPIEMNDLLKCPLATEYMIYKSFNPQIKSEVIDKELTAQRNPLWSKCTSIKYPVYEGLFNSEQIELYTREIYPYCFDFYGINIGGSNNYYIPCTYNLDMNTSSSSSLSNNKLLYYSQHNDKILIPYYLQRMFQSIDLNGVTNIQVNSTIARYKAQYLPEYPQFPQVTTVICDPKEYEIDTSSSPSPKPSIPITFPPTGMTSTPTVLSPSTHAHIGWSFSGNDQTTITLTAKPFNNTTSAPQNTTQFLWGQIIGEPRPSSSLHATAQLPSVSGSTLFGQIYSQLNGNNNNNNDNNQQQHPLVTAYTTNGLVFTSFINQNATMMSTQDLSTTTSSLSTLQTTTTTTTTFNLPMLCDSLSIVCDDTTSQFCNQSTGTCECRDGYEIDTSSSSLKCISICQNSGVYNPITSLCDCTRPGTTGRYCEITDKCHVNHISFITDQIDPKSSSSSTILPQYDKSIADVYTAECNNGYYGYSTVFDEIKQQTEDICGGNNNDKKCTCFSPYWNTTESSSSSSESLSLSSQCSTCLLEPLSTDTMKTQIKNTGIQRCYITGTNPITYANGQCTKCICKKGYSGEYCHIHTTYAQFKYQGYKNNEQKYLYDSVNEAILFDKFAHEVMLSLTRYDKDKISVYEHNLKYKYVIIAIQTDLDYFQRNLDEMSSSSSPFQIQQSIISSLLSLSSLPSSTSDLYQQWLNMQNKFNSTPINNQESNEFLGGVQPPTDSQVYDPSCTEQGYTDCSQTTSFFPEDQHKTTSVVGMIIGIVIAAVCVILFFIIVICVVKYAKNNKKWCYEEKKKKKNDNDDNSFKVQDNSYKGSTSAPSTLGSTISLMPMSATSGSGNTADSIKSVNNHTEVHDESLVGTDWKAYKDSKYQMFYVNQTTMESRWKHPINDDMDGDDKGW